MPDLFVPLRLLGALALGGVVAFIYRRTRPASATSPSFIGTLVLLSVLIAMVTQVIGDNVARAFSLVGALSIVRFRTVVRDTQDTAYVIFSVAVGMAIGANDPWVAVTGLAIVALGAVILRGRFSGAANGRQTLFLLHVRVGLGHDVGAVLTGPIDALVVDRHLISMETARQGMAIDVAYRVTLRDDTSADDLVRTLNRIEGVQSVGVRSAEATEAL
jgi:hypothetical protein